MWTPLDLNFILHPHSMKRGPPSLDVDPPPKKPQMPGSHGEKDSSPQKNDKQRKPMGREKNHSSPNKVDKKRKPMGKKHKKQQFPKKS